MKRERDLTEDELTALVVAADATRHLPEAEAETAFRDAFDAAMRDRGLGPWPHEKLLLCDCWCANHGEIASQVSQSIALQKAADHKKEVPGLHAIRMLCMVED